MALYISLTAFSIWRGFCMSGWKLLGSTTYVFDCRNRFLCLKFSLENAKQENYISILMGAVGSGGIFMSLSGRSKPSLIDRLTNSDMKT